MPLSLGWEEPDTAEMGVDLSRLEPHPVIAIIERKAADLAVSRMKEDPVR
jgi:hypothetical protein